jgi:hypothetical protein
VKRLAGLIGVILAFGSVVAGPAFITMPPAITPVARPVQAPGPLRAPADLNQAAMSQIINQLNQRQFQLSVAAAQTTVQRPIFVPRTISVKRAK